MCGVSFLSVCVCVSLVFSAECSCCVFGWCPHVGCHGYMVALVCVCVFIYSIAAIARDLELQTG